MINRLISMIMTMAMLLGLSACASVNPLRVDKAAQASPLTDKNIVLINQTNYDLEIRRALTKVGFNVKKFAAVKERQMPEQGGTVTFNEAESRYGITQYPGRTVDFCLGFAGATGNYKFKDFALEVADLKTNNVVLTISKGGWVIGCGMEDGSLFDELASALRSNWN
jgi:hypothetical protein